MQANADRTALDESVTEFDLLRTTLLRTAKALVVAEDRRAELLHRLAARADATAAHQLRADAHQARANAETAMGVVVQIERMSSRALSRTGLPRVIELPAHPAELAGAGRP